MEQKKIYLSGKISGDPNFKEKFAQKEKELTEQGHLVFNPAKHPDMFTWEQFMELDLKALGNCDSIYLLNDWKDSRGAKIEYDEAVRLGKEVIFEDKSKSINIRKTEPSSVINSSLSPSQQLESVIRLAFSNINLKPDDIHIISERLKKGLLEEEHIASKRKPEFLYFSELARNESRVEISTPITNADYFTEITGIPLKYKDSVNVSLDIHILYDLNEKTDDFVWSHNGIKFTLGRFENSSNGMSSNLVNKKECSKETAEKAFLQAEKFIKDKTGLSVKDYIQKEKKGIYHDFICNLKDFLPSDFTNKQLLSISRKILKSYNEGEKSNLNTVLFNKFLNAKENKEQVLVEGLTKDIKSLGVIKSKSHKNLKDINYTRER